MGAYKYIQKLFREHNRNLLKGRLVEWRSSNTVERIDSPLNIVRARSLGYKAKKGFAIVRVKTGRGARKRPHPWGGRKPGKNYAYVAPAKSLQHIAQERVARKFSNMEVLNSYWVGENSTTKFFEVILVDMQIQPMQLQRGRAFRGLTHAARKHRNI